MTSALARRVVGPLALGILAGCPSPVPESPPEPAVAPFPDRPQPGAPASFTPTLPVRTTLSNGVPVYVVHDPGLPLVSVRLVVPTGPVTDPAGKYGRAALGTSMLQEGAGERSSLEQAAALSALAASMSFAIDREHLVMALDAHVDELGRAVPLAADALLRPRFDPSDWARVQEQHVNALLASYDDNPSVARVVAARRWYGAAHPYGTPSGGTPETAGSLKLDDVRAWHKEHLHAGGAVFVVVGAATADAVTSTLEASFGSWTALPRPDVVVPPPAAPTGLVIVDSPGSTQTVITAVAAGQTHAAPDRASLDIGRTVMGGSFTSRLNRRLREELGLTYGARMGATRLRSAGTISSGGAFRADATVQALTELRALLLSASDQGYTPDEIARGRAQVLTDLVDGAETRAGLAELFAGEIAAGRQPEDLRTWLSGLDATSPDTAKAASTFHPDQTLFVLVGDLSGMEAPLREAGFTTWVVSKKDGT
jgi:zinc protease